MQIIYEKGFDNDTLEGLKNRGHVLAESGGFGSMTAIGVDGDGIVTGYSDPRRPGSVEIL